MPPWLLLDKMPEEDTRAQDTTAQAATETGARLSDETFQRLLGLVFDGDLSPGDRLPSERALSNDFGVSRTTLRDALNRLEARGYVQRKPKSGTYISTSLTESLRAPVEEVVDSKVLGFRDILAVRKTLELWAVAEAARQATPEPLEDARAALQAMKSNAPLETDAASRRYSEADLRFHQAIAEMTQNALYVHLLHFLGNLVLRSVSLSQQLVTGDFGTENYRRHAAIYEALEAGDAEQARAAMWEHFAFIEQHLSSEKQRA